MARRTNDIDSDIESFAEAEAPSISPVATTPLAPTPADVATPGPSSSSGPAILGGGAVLGGGIVLGGGVLYQEPVYAQPLTMIGGEGVDVFYGGMAGDLLIGNGGDDFIKGHDGHDTILGGTGNDTLDGGNGADWIVGDAGDDRIDGGGNDDRLEGREGLDIMQGGGGNDVLIGGAGNDQLNGGFGVDFLSGGEGRDVFVLGHANLFQWGQPQTPDTITDFQAAGTMHDIIAIRDALNGTTFSGTSVSQAVAQGYIYFVQHGSRGNADFGTTIYIDRNGSAADIAPDIAVADLLGVGKSELTYGYSNPHIIL